ncbi:uncharacterized protein DNG_05389 [Cephalotrichum gorgonifer]|uniref:Uncharacterized protein n=1 Tax=Cephalotrichum gorgonifer TaxID=2041049 RepID=A0AAE8SVQ7_9PEZI|nr:uncharacterized protein DNG_05389 [Cephalotrichum gorgonifer]
MDEFYYGILGQRVAAHTRSV